MNDHPHKAADDEELEVRASPNSLNVFAMFNVQPVILDVLQATSLVRPFGVSPDIYDATNQ